MSASGDPLAPAGTGEDGWSLLRAMFGASNVIAGVVEVLDDDFLYVAANAAACALFGLPDGEMQGKRGRDLGLSEAQIATRMETLRQCLATGEARLSDYAFETNGRPPRWLTGAFNRLPATRPLVSFVIVDLTERRNAEEQARIQAARLALAVEAAEIGIWEFDVSTGAVTWDGRMRRMFGAGPEQAIDFDGFARRVHPEDLPAVQAALQGALAGESEGRYHVEHRTAPALGAMRWIRGSGQVHFDGAGRALRVFGTALDVTDEVAARESQALMVQELNHRVKNNLAMVQAIADNTLRSSRQDPALFAEAFRSRLQSLARAQDLLSRTAWGVTPLGEVFDAALAPFDLSAFALSLGATPVALGADLALNLVMVLHELATNAAKYGALSSPDGRVSIVAEVTDGALEIAWRELGGPAVSPPARTGFGTRLKRAALSAFGGEDHTDFHPDGLCCSMRMPIGKAVFLAPPAGQASPD